MSFYAAGTLGLEAETASLTGGFHMVRRAPRFSARLGGG